jgi:hypothetical protein
MDLKILKRTVVLTSLIAIAFATAIAIFTPIPFWIAAAILVFSWPVTDLIIERIGARNPQASARVKPNASQARYIIVTQFTIMGVLAVGVSAGLHVPYLTGFSYILLFLAPIGSINSILAESEDNAPGGFNNPDDNRKE